MVKHEMADTVDGSMSQIVGGRLISAAIPPFLHIPCTSQLVDRQRTSSKADVQFTIREMMHKIQIFNRIRVAEIKNIYHSLKQLFFQI